MSDEKESPRTKALKALEAYSLLTYIQAEAEKGPPSRPRLSRRIWGEEAGARVRRVRVRQLLQLPQGLLQLPPLRSLTVARSGLTAMQTAPAFLLFAATFCKSANIRTSALSLFQLCVDEKIAGLRRDEGEGGRRLIG